MKGTLQRRDPSSSPQTVTENGHGFPYVKFDFSHRHQKLNHFNPFIGATFVSKCIVQTTYNGCQQAQST